MKRYGVALDNRVAGWVAQPEVLAESEPDEEKTKARCNIADRKNSGEGIKPNRLGH